MEKNILRKNIIAIILCFILMLLTITACSGENTNDSSEDVTKSKVENTQNESENKKEKQTVDLSGKKIVIVVEIPDPALNVPVESALKVYKNNGIQDDQITIYNKPEDIKDLEGLAKKIKDTKPDLVHIIPGIPDMLRKNLSDSNIPVVVGALGELACDENGVPKGNITGLRAFPKDIVGRVHNILNEIAPLNGKKVAYIRKDSDESFTPENVTPFLKSINTELKGFYKVKNREECLEYARKVANDSEIGWVIIPTLPNFNKDGSQVSPPEIAKEMAAIIKKPIGTFFDAYVGGGILTGVTLNINEVFGSEVATMGVEILNGKEVKEVALQEPQMISIVFNKKTADELKVNISDDLISAAYRVYTDFDNNYIGKN